MSLGAVVAEVGEVMGRAHALFGEPPASGAEAASGAGAQLSGAGALVESGGRDVTSGMSGRFATSYGVFAGGAGPALDVLAGDDRRLGDRLAESATSDRSGRTTSSTVVTGAATDTAGLAPYSNTPAGQKALLTALRTRVVQQQQVVAAHRARDARMAALLRSMTYAGRGGVRSGGGMPSGGGGAMPFGGGGGGGTPFGGVQGFSGLGRGAARDSRTTESILADSRRASAMPSGPGGAAARAALTKLGKPYVWGAKGPSSFDCSGLTQWAWRQAGVQLGADTYAQVTQGVPVSPGDVRAGDLIFPRNSWDGRSPGHMSMAISATEVVHAPQSGDVVKIAPMPAAYVARRVG